MCTNLRFCAGRIVPCGKCEECLKVKRITEYNRIKYEYDDSAIVYHVTLTYARLKDFDGFANIRAFIKSLRKDVGDCSYYCVYEEGELKGRPHFHILIFLKKNKYLAQSLIEEHWKNGFVKCRPISRLYEVKYLTNYLFKHYGNKNIRNFSCSNHFGYGGFLGRNFDKDYLLYISKGRVGDKFVSKYFDVNKQIECISNLYYGEWRYLPRNWKEKYYKLVNHLLPLLNESAVMMFYEKMSGILLSKQHIELKYFEHSIEYSNANAYYYGVGRSWEEEKNLKCAGIYYSVFVPQFGCCNMYCGYIQEFYKWFVHKYLNYFEISYSQVPKEWNDDSKRLKYLRDTRSDFLHRCAGENYFGVDGVFMLSSKKLNNLVFL